MDAMKFGPTERDELQELYDVAVAKGVDSLNFRGNELIVDYAKYLLEFLDMQFK